MEMARTGNHLFRPTHKPTQRPYTFLYKFCGHWGAEQLVAIVACGKSNLLLILAAHFEFRREREMQYFNQI